MAIYAPSDRSVARSWPAVIAGVLGLGVDGAYLWLILAEGENDTGRVGAFAILVASFSGLALVGGLAYRASPRLRLGILGAASGGLLTAGVVGIFSIGLPLLIAGVLSCVAWAVIKAATHPVPPGALILSLLAAIGAGALLVLGIVLT